MVNHIKHHGDSPRSPWCFYKPVLKALSGPASGKPIQRLQPPCSLRKKRAESPHPCAPPAGNLVYNQFMARKHSLEILLKELRQRLPTLAERYGVETLEVFGSYVRAEQKADSDLDVLVTFQEAPSLLTFIALENYLSDELGVKVDLVMKDSLKPAIGKVILSEAMPV